MPKNELVIQLEAAESDVRAKQAKYAEAAKEAAVNHRNFFAAWCYLELAEFSAVVNKPKDAYNALQVAQGNLKYAEEEHRVWYDCALEVQARAQNKFQVALDELVRVRNEVQVSLDELAQANLEVTSLKVSHDSD